ncbi:epoxide hydrolase family protein [Pseudonocardia spinosispora]|uniref:epoxide hydrolase family protein n=1 Tax=Pseudonocardia spinosispora TaxID=103441 RepID=UPI00041A8D64|nr:epoxide hydrolase family protein [Pseudonocardia spinosispora]
MVEIREFTVDIAEAQITDLRERLGRTRWPERETVQDWSQGIPLDYVRELAEYWARDYDMRRLATRLNAFPQFHATIGDLGVHFLHIRSRHENARPLLLTHGWPGSVLEFLQVIEPLTDPTAHGGTEADAFHLVIPALPGYGFSDKPGSPGTGIERIGATWDELMKALDYPRYYAQGGDWGGLVTAALAVDPPDGLLGVHLNFLVPNPQEVAGFDDPTPDEQQLGGLQYYVDQEAGYSTQQSTRPQTLGYGLADSPVGQLAWIVEKFYAWTDCAGHPENAVSRDELLDNVMIYWLTNSATSSARLYWESMKATFTSFDPISLPSAYSRFPKELLQVSERWARTRLIDLRRYGSLDKGGHFAALEQPTLFVEEVRAAIGALAADR